MSGHNTEFKARVDSDEISFRIIILKLLYSWQFLLKNWISVIIVGVIGGVIGLSYAFYKKPIYTATTTFVLEDDNSSGSLSGLSGLASMAGVDLGGSGGGIFQGDNILQLYKSRTMLEKTLLTPINSSSKELLVDRYIQFNNLKKRWKNQPELLKLKFSSETLDNPTSISGNSRLQDSILGSIIKDLNKEYLTVIRPDKKLSSFQVDVRATDELFAKVFNDALVRNVNAFYISTKTAKTQQNVNILQHKTDSVRSVMNGSIYSAAAIADATPNLNPTRQVQRVAPSQRAQFSAESNKSILTEMVKNLELTKLTLLKETPLIQVIDIPIFPLNKSSQNKLTSFLVGLFLGILICSIYLLIRRFLKDEILRNEH